DRAFLTTFAEAARVTLPSGTLEVIPEASGGRDKRFDILLRVDGHRACVVEVKCKTAGTEDQLQRYAKEGIHVGLVGFDELNFPDLSNDARERFPLVKFAEISEMIDAARAKSQSPYAPWLQDFSRQLRREGDAFTGIRRYFIDE